jgi:hypothetical protein
LADRAPEWGWSCAVIKFTVKRLFLKIVSIVDYFQTERCRNVSHIFFEAAGITTQAAPQQASPLCI